MIADAQCIARDYMKHWLPGSRLAEPADVRPIEDFCSVLADWYDRAPWSARDSSEQREYRRFKDETYLQFKALREAQILVEPWLGDGQPYASSADLRRKFSTTGTLYIYLTSSGHGPGASPGTGDGAPAEHPMREPAGITANGVPLLHNDLFRAVHDIFGHVVHGNRFSLEGELRASWDHMQMYSPDCRRALLTETLCQISWFYRGPHLRRRDGTIPDCGDADYIRPSQRPYPIQKTSLVPHEFVGSFHSLFADRWL